ncbi:MAG: metal ABC transporter ATP-binding protein [Verrucomicrobiota bacterium]|nr:metal ABC transporter ATP-binding protein [Verrucomicrobiota bacterium]
MHKIFLSLLLVIAIFSLGCATTPNKIEASYVSPYKYKDFDEDQIIMEMDHVARRTNELYYSLKKEASNDSAQMAIGLLLFWPALFFLEGGDGPEAAEYARLKGEYEALRTVAVQKKISFDKLPPSPEQLIQDFADEEKEKKDSRSKRAEAGI